jgi:hypothetical protein
MKELYDVKSIIPDVIQHDVSCKINEYLLDKEVV